MSTRVTRGQAPGSTLIHCLVAVRGLQLQYEPASSHMTDKYKVLRDVVLLDAVTLIVMSDEDPKLNNTPGYKV
jgi:hypothetical protein